MALSSQRHLLVLLVFFVAAATLGATSCNGSSSEQGSVTVPWEYQSERGSYEVDVPGHWEQVPAEELNRFADLALKRDGHLYFIVIPQELPSFDGVESPDAAALKDASLDLLSQRVDGFTVEREGPVMLDGKPGISVLAVGRTDQSDVQYVNTYVTADQWGYQIVAWGPADATDELVDATDELFDSWTFVGASSGEPGANVDDDESGSAED